MTLVNQLAEADVKSREGMLAHSATIGVVDGTSSELPACRLRRVTQYMQENLQRELRLAELGALVHMSPFHFARLFRQSTGMPPHRFLVRSLERSQRRVAIGTRNAVDASVTGRYQTGMASCTPLEHYGGSRPINLISRPSILRNSHI